MKPFDSLVGTDTRAVLQEAERIGELVSRNVPAHAAARILFCRLHEGQLRIVVDSAAWVAKLRFLERQLERALIADGLRIRRISWHVAPAEQPRTAAPRAARQPLRPHVARHVQAVAQGMEDDPLSRALTRLADQLGRGSRDGRGDGSG